MTIIRAEKVKKGFMVPATVDDPNLIGDAKFTYRIIDNINYIISDSGRVTVKEGYTPKQGDRFTVEVIYKGSNGLKSKGTKIFTIKI